LIDDFMTYSPHGREGLNGRGAGDCPPVRAALTELLREEKAQRLAEGRASGDQHGHAQDRPGGGG